MDQITTHQGCQMCIKHPKRILEFVQVNNISNSPNDNLFYCSACINKDLAFKGVDYLLISEIIQDGEDKIIQKWPPVNDYNIIEQLIGLTDISDSSTSAVNSINQYFTCLKEEFLRKVDLCEKRMINRALELPLGNDSILKQYQEISQINKLRNIIIEGERKNVEAHKEVCREFIASVESQKQQNSELLQVLLEQGNQKEQLINYEYPDLIKSQIFSFIDEIDFFNHTCLSSNSKQDNREIDENSHSNKIFKLISNKTNFCSSNFLSQIKVLLDKINPLLSSVSFENMHQPNKTPIEFSSLCERRFDLTQEFIENQIKIEKNREFSTDLKNTLEYQLLESVINSNINCLNENLKDQLKLFLIDSYPLLRQVNFTNGILERDQFDCLQNISDVDTQDLFNLIKQKQKLVSDNEFNQSVTKLIKETNQHLFQQFQDADVIFRKYPIFDLMKKQPCSIKLVKTDFQDGNSRILINQDNQLSMSQAQYNGLYKNWWINCVSDKVLDKERKYVFRFKIEHFREDGFGLCFGLMSNRKCDTDSGQNEHLSCRLTHQNNQFQYSEDRGISKQLKGGQLKLSSENELEMRVWLGGQQLEILDYPKYDYKVGIRDEVKYKLNNMNDLKLYIGIWCEKLKVILKSTQIVANFVD